MLVSQLYSLVSAFRRQPANGTIDRGEVRRGGSFLENAINALPLLIPTNALQLSLQFGKPCGDEPATEKSVCHGGIVSEAT